jgi:hypothetical protein
MFTNRIIISGIMIFQREVQYLMQPFSCQHGEQYISKKNYEITIVLGSYGEDLYFQI